jgi:TRAP transporter TAXI family solute receptor
LHWVFLSMLAIAALGNVSACRREPSTVRQARALRLGVGSTGGDFDVMGRALVDTMKRGQPPRDVQIVVNQGAVTSLESLQQGTSDCGFSYANITYEAFAGKLADEPGPMTHLRGVALVERAPLHLFARPGSGIRTVTDLAGKRVNIGLRGSASAHAAQLVLDAFNLKRLVMESDTPGGLRQLLEGEVDAVFLVAGTSRAFVSRMLETAKLISVEGPPIDRLRERYPFFRPMQIPAATYPRQTDAVRTVGIQSVLLCREDVAPEDVQRITRDWLTTFGRLVADGEVSDGVSTSIASAPPIPLHGGATDDYRSRQVMVR